ncbi:MAG: cytidylate kinase family protein [Spirochaetales bacterium]|nr:cytidylate kinase family protein [Spirochaetales bacterium]
MIVTISRQPGSLGEEIAIKLAEEKGFGYLDRDVLKKRLLDQKLPEFLIDKYDEKNPGYWSSFSEKKERYLNNLKMVILDFADNGDCVLVGRGAQVLFAGIPGVVKVRITAPHSNSVRQFSKEKGCSEKDAERIIGHINNERKGFYRSFFNAALESPELYDLIINTKYLDVDGAVGIISGLIEVKKNMDCSLDDLILKQKIIEELLYIRKIPVHDLNVTVVKGTITLIGSVLVKENVDLCRVAAMGIQGVTSVNTERVMTRDINTYGI